MDSTTAITGKRKSDDAFPPSAAAADVSQPKNLFALLSDENWKTISAFAAPPDVYSLSLSSVHFFREATGTEASSEDKKVLATHLLRSSLLSSLGRVLEKSNSGITLEAVLKMGDLPEGSALIAGSTIVAACLGKDWSDARWPDSPGDVDVYCSAEAAPKVRSWLVEEANCMFIGVNGYIDMACDRLLYVVDTKFHHVESWGSFSENFEDKYPPRWRNGEDKEAEYREKIVQWGTDAAEHANWKWKHSMDFGILGLGTNKDGSYDIKTESGNNLPFDFFGSGKIDLIVAKSDTAASALLDGFDLEICKASFDGKKFHIPDPHLTFTGKTRMESNRRAVVGSYVKHHREPKDRPRRMMPMEYSRLASSTIRTVRRDVPHAPFYRILDVAAALDDWYDPDADRFDDEGTFFDPMVRAKWGPPIQFHNWCCALVKRLRKYQKRGIEVVDAPTIPHSFKTDRYHVNLFHMG